MPMMEDGTIDIEFEVWCDTCGAGLCNTVRVEGTDIHVPACERCLEYTRVEAMAEALDELGE